MIPPKHAGGRRKDCIGGSREQAAGRLCGSGLEMSFTFKRKQVLTEKTH